MPTRYAPAQATTKTIRYYELLGLLPEPERTESGYRMYEEKDVERLIFIKKAKSLGFSLTDIGETLAIADSESPPCVHVLALLDRKVHEIDRLVSELRGLQQELVRLRDESSARIEPGGQICGIVERSVHKQGEVALTWLESVGKRGGD